VLNPFALIEEAKNEAMKPFEGAKKPEPVNVETYNVE